jgi:hypothetical protein
MAGLTAASALSSALSSRSKKQTSKSKTVTTPTFDPSVAPLLGEAGDIARKQMLNPQMYTDPLRVGARQKINDSYSGVNKSLASKYLGYGGGQSGKFASGVRGADLSRLSALGGLESDFANLNLQQMMQGQGAVERLLQIGRGTTSTSEGETTIPGDPVGAGIGSGLQTATMLFGLNSMLKGGKGLNV